MGAVFSCCHYLCAGSCCTNIHRHSTCSHADVHPYLLCKKALHTTPRKETSREQVIKRHAVVVARKKKLHITSLWTQWGTDKWTTCRGTHQMPAGKDMALMDNCWCSWTSHKRPVQRKQMLTGNPGFAHKIASFCQSEMETTTAEPEQG